MDDPSVVVRREHVADGAEAHSPHAFQVRGHPRGDAQLNVHPGQCVASAEKSRRAVVQLAHGGSDRIAGVRAQARDARLHVGAKLLKLAGGERDDALGLLDALGRAGQKLPHAVGLFRQFLGPVKHLFHNTGGDTSFTDCHELPRDGEKERLS